MKYVLFYETAEDGLAKAAALYPAHKAALVVLAGAAHPGTRVDLDVEWPVPVRDAYRSWQPAEPSEWNEVLTRP